ncbi:MAG TPA: hypothetical protein VFW28_20505 [Micropepsaceae bacterium]|nr:hypothetical protein [Micropepsaceae bacterium]
MIKTALRHSAGPVAGAVIVMLAAAATAQPGDERIPQFASTQFGWQTNLEDWQDPPPGSGHGPMRNDPAYPYLSNYDANRQGKQPTIRITNSKDPILKPWAQEEIQKTNEELLSGERQVPFTAQSRCWPGGVPGQLLYPFEPVYFIQTPKEVWMIWQRDHVVRRVFLNRPHSQNIKPSWFGESVGHYENGDTLVVDTIGLSTYKSYIDNFRTPHTEQEHVVERFTIAPDGKSMTAIARVDDPGAYNGPITMKEFWFKANQPMLETVCPENNEDFFHQNLYAIPEAKTADF